MAKRGRKKKVWIEDFAEQQKSLLAKHARCEELTQEEICYLVGKDGKMPKRKEDMMSKMSICKIEKKALAKLQDAICKSYPKWTRWQVKDAMLEMLSKRAAAKELVIDRAEY